MNVSCTLTGWLSARPERSASRTLHQHSTPFRVCGSEIECSLILSPKLPALPQTLGIFPQGRLAAEEHIDSPGVHPIAADCKDKHRNSTEFLTSRASLCGRISLREIYPTVSLCFLQVYVPAFSEATRSEEPPVRPAEMYRQSSPIPSENLPLKTPIQQTLVPHDLDIPVARVHKLTRPLIPSATSVPVHSNTASVNSFKGIPWGSSG